MTLETMVYLRALGIWKGFPAAEIGAFRSLTVVARAEGPAFGPRPERRM
jgi:hypothetical protein